MKQEYLKGEDATLPEPEAGLAGGITVGDKRSIGPALSADFQKVSLIQMIVLSGYNITVVANFAARLLMWTSKVRAIRCRRLCRHFFHPYFRWRLECGACGDSWQHLRCMPVFPVAPIDALRALAVVAFVMNVWNPFHTRI